MARGYPDFYGQSAFPWLGEALHLDAPAVPVASLATVSVFLLNARAVLHGGSLMIDAAAFDGPITLTQDFEGVQLAAWDINTLFSFGVQHNGYFPWRLTRYDLELNIFCVSFSPQTSIGQSMELSLTNFTSGAVTLQGIFWYSIMT